MFQHRKQCREAAVSDYNQYSKPVPPWLWIFALLSVSLFVGLLYYLDQYEKGNIKPDQGIDIKELFAGNKTTQKSTGETKKEPGKKKPNFEFYSLLRDLEVIVPESEIPTESDVDNKPENAPQNLPDSKTLAPHTTAPSSDERLANKGQRFFVQAGSFKDYAAADRMKANLALLGVVAKIESVKIPKSGTWHRVRVGPYTNKQQISKVRRILKTNHIDSITVKIKS